MRYRYFYLLILISSILYSQPEFTISVDEFKWENPSSSRVTLSIFLTIKNVGNQAGWCEDVYKGLYLYCPNSYYDDKIEIYDYSKNITNNIKPGDKVEAFISYTVPREADDLSLRFDEFYGGATKYLTESYNKYLEKNTDKKFDNYVTEADLKVTQNYPEEAVNLYKMALELDVEKYKKDEVRQKLGKTHEIIGDKNAGQKIWGFALDEYKLALEYTNSFAVKEKIGAIYKQIGDEKLSAGLKKEAVENYDLSLKYKEDVQLRIKRNELNDEAVQKEKRDKAEKKARDDYQKLLKPKVGFKLVGGIGFQQKDGGKTGTFWSASLSAIPKLYVGRSTPLTFAVNVDFSAAGMINNSTNTQNFRDYYGLGDTVVASSGYGDIIEYSLSAGAGFGFLNNSFTPMVFVSYGAYVLKPTFNLFLPGSTDAGTRIEEMYWGHGFKAELMFIISRKVFFGYAFKSFQISTDDYDFIDGRYSGHMISAGAFIF